MKYIIPEIHTFIPGSFLQTYLIERCKAAVPGKDMQRGAGRNMVIRHQPEKPAQGIYIKGLSGLFNALLAQRGTITIRGDLSAKNTFNFSFQNT